MKSYATLAALLLTLYSCQSTPPAAPRAESGTRFFSDTRDDVPAEPLELRTTHGDIYLNNLNARIAALSEAIEERGTVPTLRILLAMSLAHRA